METMAVIPEAKLAAEIMAAIPEIIRAVEVKVAIPETIRTVEIKAVRIINDIEKQVVSLFCVVTLRNYDFHQKFLDSPYMIG